ncbi:MAG: hypothetical protein NCW75_07180 [Phycisphaera sp.]|nr:MAG: hypothetical protein NCW75_07180 [Phycisphaera sp.]
MTRNIMIVLASSAAAQTVLYEQDFEDLTLLPFVSSSECCGDGTDWTDELPAGWDFDNGDTPSDGPAEFFGFTFLDINSWIATAGDQDRSTFVRGTGTVMVADGDEYDDLGSGIEPDLFNVLVRTPAIDVTSVASGLLEIAFDSSFRPYDTMTGLVEVSFNSGLSFDNLLTLNVDTVPGGSSSLERANEAIALSVAIPSGATDAIVQFRMADTGNDWWWAIDNIVVSEGTGAPSPFGFVTTSEAVFETTTPVIEWEAAADADDYSIIVAREADLSSVVFDDDGIISTRAQVGPLNSGRYYVSVTAINVGGEREILDAPLSFFVVNPCPADFNGDGSLDIFDFLAFSNAFDAGCP